MKHSKLLLSPRHKRILYGTSAILWISGAVWLILQTTAPSRPLWMKIHGAAAMVFLILFGTLLAQHVPAGRKQDRRRPSGGMLLWTCGLLGASGWGLYYFGSENLRHWTSAFHSILGIAFPAIIFVHVAISALREK